MTGTKVYGRMIVFLVLSERAEQRPWPLFQFFLFYDMGHSASSVTSGDGPNYHRQVWNQR